MIRSREDRRCLLSGERRTLQNLGDRRCVVEHEADRGHHAPFDLRPGQPPASPGFHCGAAYQLAGHVIAVPASVFCGTTGIKWLVVFVEQLPRQWTRTRIALRLRSSNGRVPKLVLHFVPHSSVEDGFVLAGVPHLPVPYLSYVDRVGKQFVEGAVREWATSGGAA